MEKTLNVTVLGKDYSFPQDLLKYIDALQLSESACDALIKRVKAQIKLKNGNDLVTAIEQMDDKIKEQVGTFIKKLCEHGIYSQTVESYLGNTRSYKNFKDCVEQAHQQLYKNLVEEVNNYIDSYNRAESRAMDSVTGSGISVWSNSASTLIGMSAYDYFVAKKQLKNADIEFKDEMRRASSQGKSAREKKDNKYIYDVFIPQLFSIFSALFSEILDFYVNDLINANLFDSETLQYTDIKRSQDLLSNLTLSADKTAVLSIAFSVCPYNPNVYLNMAENEQLSDGEINASTTFGITDTIVEYFHKKLIEAKGHCLNLASLLENSAKTIDMLCRLTGRTYDYYANNISTEIYENVRAQYRILKSANHSAPTDCAEILMNGVDGLENLWSMSGDDFSKTIANYIHSIINESDFDLLCSKCNHSDLLLLIAPEEYSFELTKNNVDNYYINSLTENFCALTNEEKAEIQRRKTKNNLSSQDNSRNANSSTGGCYVATAVYGSYDCPQVWTLRRYRDYTLAKSWYGRAFIRTYYAISPTLVKWFGHTEWFKKMWKGKLDRMVTALQSKGFENTLKW